MIRRIPTNCVVVRSSLVFFSPFLSFRSSSRLFLNFPSFAQPITTQRRFVRTTTTLPKMGCSSSSDATTTTASTVPLNIATLKRQDDITSGAVLALLKDNADFKALSAKEGTQLIDRDKEDEDKLAKGIELSIAKGVLERLAETPTTTQINVLGKSADEVANEIFSRLPKGGEASVLILQGLSGTGKGTTVSKLKAKLDKCICWSNGNVFRTVTHLVNENLNQAGQDFTSEAITGDLLKSCFDRLDFKQFGDDTFDVVIDDTQRVSEIANTTLKTPSVSTRVPTVAELTQGEVVKFAAKAVETLRAAGHNVILEGRAQTLNFIPTSFRFELVIPEVTILGSRRAAQRVMAFALEQAKDKKDDEVTEENIAEWCKDASKTLH